MQIIGCAPGGALRGWAPLASRPPSGFDSLRGVKMYALSPGCGSFRRRPFSGSPCPPRRCGGGWAAAPASACRGVPPALAPVAPGARRAVCAQGFLSAASGRPCAPLCVSPLCSAPSLARAGLRGVRSLSLPRGGSCWRGLRRAFWCLRRPRGVWAGAALLCSCARSMLHQACACCPHSRCLAWALVSPPENINNALSERTLRKRYAAPLPYLHKRFSA